MDKLIVFLGGYAGIFIAFSLFFTILWFIVLLILRPLILWYLKINNIIKEQELTNGYLSQIVSQNESLRRELSRQNRNTSSSDTYQSEHTKYMPK